MTKYKFRSLNTDRESKTRIGAAFGEYLDYFRSERFDIPKSFYAILIGTAPVVILGTYLRSVCTNEPIEKLRKTQL